MHCVGVGILSFIGGLLVAVVYSIYRAKKFAKVQEEVKERLD